MVRAGGGQAVTHHSVFLSFVLSLSLSLTSSYVSQSYNKLARLSACIVYT